MAKKEQEIEDPIEKRIASIVVDSEYAIAKSDKDVPISEYESLLDMLECRRNEKDYDWMSDNFIPEMNSIHLTDCSQWANQYFQTRDFVEVKLDGETPEQKLQASGAKKLINKTLNNRDVYYYQKYIRLRSINSLVGEVWILARWEQDIKTFMTKKAISVRTGKDIYGQPLTSDDQIPEMVQEEREVPTYSLTKDQWNFDVLDPRNVFTDNKYCYSAQQKDWITLLYEGNLADLKANEEREGYFNLDKVEKELKGATETETSKSSYNKDDRRRYIDDTPVKNFDMIDRYGKFWAIPKDNNGQYPEEAEPGIDNQGKPLEDAELLEMIITFVLIGSKKIMVRFRPTDCIDSEGNPFKPIARGLCYIHPANDSGLSDGKNMRELQISINDTYNINSDRVKLATLPTFIGRKYALEDNSSVYIEPEHIIEVEDPHNDLIELKISDNIQGGIQQLNMLTAKMQQVTSIYPTTMGGLPDKAGTTATAVAGGENKANARANYKSLTSEYTVLSEIYWLILQMSFRFMKTETALKMMNEEEAKAFKPNLNYTYTPVSTNIESEYNKNKKIQNYDQTIGRLSGLVEGLPELIPIIAHIVGRQLVLQGDEFQEIGTMIEKLTKAKFQNKDGKGGPEQPKDMKDEATSNEQGLPMSQQEKGAREGAFTGGGQIQ